MIPARALGGARGARLGLTVASAITLMLLALHPNPSEHPGLATGISAASMGIVGSALLLIYVNSVWQALRIDALDVVLLGVAGVLFVATGRPSFLAFGGSLFLARALLREGVGNLPMGWLTLGLIVVMGASLTSGEAGRYALAIGDPNFTAAIGVLFLIAALNNQRQIDLYTASYSSVALLLVYLTGSRMGALSAIAAVCCLGFPREGRSSWLTKCLYSGLFILSMAGPFVAIVVQGAGIAFVGAQGGAEELGAIDDASNLQRVIGYAYAGDVLLDSRAWASGVDAYATQLPQGVVVPHNWFLGSLVQYGVPLTIVAAIYLFTFGWQLGERPMLLWGTYLLAAGTLNVAIVSSLYVIAAAICLAQRGVGDASPTRFPR